MTQKRGTWHRRPKVLEQDDITFLEEKHRFCSMPLALPPQVGRNKQASEGP